jgi:hypothetical protein
MRTLPGDAKVADPLSLNLYTYCANNPVLFFDPSGNAWETVLDIGGIVWSAVDLAMNPSWANVGFLLWDVGATLLPFVPGSYTAKGARLLARGANTTGDLIRIARSADAAHDILTISKGANAAEVLVDSYKNLKKFVSGTGLEVHHLIEKRFAGKLGLLGKENLFPSIAIDSDLHQTITNLFRKEIGHITDINSKLRITGASPNDVWAAIVKVYTELGMEGLLSELKEFIIDNSDVIITEWCGVT